MTQHTPGPWEVAKDCGDFDTLAVYDANGRKVVFWGGHYNASDAQGRANAALLAAAPLMLAALTEIAALPYTPNRIPDYADDAMTQVKAIARSAIAPRERIATMTQHTPGPWEVEHPYEEPGTFVSGPLTELIARVYPGPECEANAAMIAAAPQMLAALKRFASYCEQHSAPELQGIACDAFAAIAAAITPDA